MMEMNKETFAFLIIFATVFIGVFHEAAHGFVAILYGNQVVGWYIGFPLSYAILKGTEATLHHPLIGLSGGLIDCIGFSLLFIWARKPQIKVDLNAKIWLILLALVRLAYGIYEMALVWFYW